MIIKSIKVLLATSLLTLGMTAFGALTEGTDYVVLEEPISDAQNTLVKVYSYDCPFCYKYAKSVDKVVAGKVPEYQFTPFHLKTKGKYGPQASELFAAALVKDQKAGLKPLDANSDFHKLEMGLYKAYHDKKMRWEDGKNPEAFTNYALEVLGWTPEQFNEYKADPKVKELVERWEIAYPIAKIQGVPAYVVNGKYLLMTKNISSIDSMADSIKELGAK